MEVGGRFFAEAVYLKEERFVLIVESASFKFPSLRWNSFVVLFYAWRIRAPSVIVLKVSLLVTSVLECYRCWWVL